MVEVVLSNILGLLVAEPGLYVESLTSAYHAHSVYTTKGWAMARMNIYLKDDLAASVKRAELEVSAICQEALREAVEVRERGIGVKIEELRAAVRLRRTTPQGRREVGATEGVLWAKDVATVKDLQTIGQVIIEMEEGEDGEDLQYEARWSDDDSGGSNFLEVGVVFETLGAWLMKLGHAVLIGEKNDMEVEIDQYFVGFVEAAQRVWQDLQPLVDEGEAILLRRIALVGEMERTMLGRDVSTTPTSGGSIRG